MLLTTRLEQMVKKKLREKHLSPSVCIVSCLLYKI